MYKRILVPLDGSKTSAAALKDALKQIGRASCRERVCESV